MKNVSVFWTSGLKWQTQTSVLVSVYQGQRRRSFSSHYSSSLEVEGPSTGSAPGAERILGLAQGPESYSAEV